MATSLPEMDSPGQVLDTAKAAALVECDERCNSSGLDTSLSALRWMKCSALVLKQSYLSLALGCCSCLRGPGLVFISRDYKSITVISKWYVRTVWACHLPCLFFTLMTWVIIEYFKCFPSILFQALSISVQTLFKCFYHGSERVKWTFSPIYTNFVELNHNRQVIPQLCYVWVMVC